MFVLCGVEGRQRRAAIWSACAMRSIPLNTTEHRHMHPLLTQEQYDAEKEEEFEDSEGNVLDRRTFEDLARQGLL